LIDEIGTRIRPFAVRRSTAHRHSGGGVWERGRDLNHGSREGEVSAFGDPQRRRCSKVELPFEAYCPWSFVMVAPAS